MNEVASRRMLALLDQAFQAGGYLLATILLARWLPIEEFAVLTTMLTVWFFFEAIQRTSILMPYIATVAVPRDDPQAHSVWMIFNIIFVVMGGLLILMASQIFSGVAGSGMALALIVMPCAAMFTYVKRVLHHIERYGAAVMISALNTAVLLAVLSLIAVDVLPADRTSGMVAYTLGYFVAAVLGLVWIRSSLIRPLNVARNLLDRLRMVSTMSAGAICAYFYNNGIQFIVAVVATAADAAAFGATRVLVRPLNVISSAVSDIERSSASRIYHQQGSRALNRFLLQLSVVLGLPLILIWIVLYIYTDNILHLLFDGKYDAFVQAGRLWLIMLLPQLLALPLDIRQSVMSQANALLLARASGALACLLVVALVYINTGGLTATTGIAAVGVGRFASLCVMGLMQLRSAA